MSRSHWEQAGFIQEYPIRILLHGTAASCYPLSMDLKTLFTKFFELQNLQTLGGDKRPSEEQVDLADDIRIVALQKYKVLLRYKDDRNVHSLFDSNEAAGFVDVVVTMEDIADVLPPGNEISICIRRDVLQGRVIPPAISTEEDYISAVQKLDKLRREFEGAVTFAKNRATECIAYLMLLEETDNSFEGLYAEIDRSVDAFLNHKIAAERKKYLELRMKTLAKVMDEYKARDVNS